VVDVFVEASARLPGRNAPHKAEKPHQALTYLAYLVCLNVVGESDNLVFLDSLHLRPPLNPAAFFIHSHA
jgi:hypothetical protein